MSLPPMTLPLDLVMLVATFGLLMAGFPVAFTLAGTALLFAFAGIVVGQFDVTLLSAIPQRVFGIMSNETLVAVPLFVFMGAVLERSGIARDLLREMDRTFRHVPGGLLLSVTLVGMLLAASTGIVGATVVTMGMMTLPQMLKRGYSPALSAGSIAAAGTLGQIIPPSIVLVVLGDQISSAYQSAQLAQGNFSPESVSVGDLFAGALVPGLLLVVLYALFQLAVAWMRPSWVGQSESSGEEQDFVYADMAALASPLVLIVLVLGSILFGVATPTEAASVGAVGSLLLAGLRQGTHRRRLAIAAGLALAAIVVLTLAFDMRVGRDASTGREVIAMAVTGVLCLAVLATLAAIVTGLIRSGVMTPVIGEATHLTVVVFTILIGATVFSLVLRGLGGDETIHALLGNLPGGTLGAVLTVMLVMFFLGFFLDFLEITFVVVPLVAPVLLAMTMPDGSPVSPVWLGVLIAVNLQTSFLTPPFGFALFYLRSVAPPELRTIDIYKGVVPFVAIQIGVLVALWFAPELATWLPERIYG